MMDWTDRHCRYFFRLLSKHTWLYTEMITAKALIYGDRKRLLQFQQNEHPVALQLGGSDIQELVQAARLGEQYGYDEINLNGRSKHSRHFRETGSALAGKNSDYSPAIVH